MKEIPNALFKKLCERINGEYVSHNFMAVGAHNEHYKLEMVGKSGLKELVVRVSCSEQLGRLSNEYNILKRLDGKYGPKVFFYDDTGELFPRDIIVEEFITGSLVEKNPYIASKDDFIKCMSYLYKKLHMHKSIVPEYLSTDNKYDLRKCVNFLILKCYRESKWILDNQLDFDVNFYISHFKKIVKEHYKEFSDLGVVSLIQGDPTKGNVFFWPKRMKKKGKIRLIDWEFARYDLKEFDLVFFMDTYDLTEEKQKSFLKWYGYFSRGGSSLKLNLVWLCHIFRILTWRIERLAYLDSGKIMLKQQSSSASGLISGIKGGLIKAKIKILNFY